MNDQPLLDLVNGFAAADLAGDVDVDDDLLHTDFRGIGPVGFALDKKAWAQRHLGDLTNHEFSVDEPEIRHLDDATVVVTAVQRQRTTAMGRDTSGSFRLGMVAVRDVDRWVIAQVQLSGPDGSSARAAQLAAGHGRALKITTTTRRGVRRCGRLS